MEFLLLGRLQVVAGGRPVALGGPLRERILAALVLAAGKPVSLTRLVEIAYDDPRDGLRKQVQNAISELRKLLTDPVIVRENSSYLLPIRRDQVDAFAFLDRTAQARDLAADGDKVGAARLLRQALALWRGPVLDGLDCPRLHQDIAGLDDARLTALESCLELELATAGTMGPLTAELRTLTAQHPTRQRLVGLLMRALHHDGNQTGALAVYQELAARLAADAGLDPASELRDLHLAILRDQLPAPAPATTAASVPAQLPLDVHGFTGRTEQLDALDAVALDADQPSAVIISAISGTAGVGKTALAVHWAHRVRGRFPDGQLYINLRGYDPGREVTAGEALNRFLTALGVPARDIPSELDDRAARYRTETDGRRLLIVLDNASSVEQVRPLLPGSPTCAVVVTSRDSLGGLVVVHGARRVNLDLLPPGDAHALLHRLIGPRVAAEPRAAGELAEQCVRLPLALRVAGEDPSAAVSAVFSWSLRRLPADVARTFRLLGLHPGADLDAYSTAALTGSDLAQATRALDLLARAHLLQLTGAGRYGMHDLLRAYAESLAEDPRAARGRLFDFYLATAAAAMDLLHPAETHRRPRVPAVDGPAPAITDAETARRWLDAERTNLAAVVAYTAAHGWPAHTVQLSTTLFRHLAGSRPTEALAIHALGRDAARQSGDPGGQAFAEEGLGAANLRLGRGKPAAEHYARALDLHRQVGNLDGEMRMLNSLGILERREGRYGPAAEFFSRVLHLARESGNQVLEADSLGNLGVLQMRQGHYKSAVDMHEQALVLHRLTDDVLGQADCLNDLAMAEVKLDRFGPATEHLEQALVLFRQVGSPSGEAHALDNLGTLLIRSGRPERATEHLQRALALFRELGDREGEAWARNGLGEAARAAGHPATALDHHLAAQFAATETNSAGQRARAHAGLGHAHRALGDLVNARRQYAQALARYRDLDSPEADTMRACLADCEPEPVRSPRG
jgi:DNA-binding SARP family transcriptional activator/tetratricopeptide (TPR) repeat protein